MSYGDALPSEMKAATLAYEKWAELSFRESTRSFVSRPVSGYRRARERKLVTIGIMNMEVAFSPGCIRGSVGIEACFLEESPEYIHVCDMKN